MLSKKDFIRVPKFGAGFTLIELLITMSIIAILSAIGLIAYSNFLKTSRDSRRQSDLKLIQSALEDFHSDQLYYPAAGTGSCSDPDHPDGLFRNNCPLSIETRGTKKVYLNKVPKDPLSSSPDYVYVAGPTNCSGPSCTRYCLYALMERLSDHTDDPSCPIPYPAGGISYKYAVTKP